MEIKETVDNKFPYSEEFLQYAKLAKRYLHPPGSTTNDCHLHKDFFQRFNKNDILKFLNNPDRHEKRLRDASIYLYHMSPHYRRLIDYYSKMATFNYYLTPLKVYSNSNINQKSFESAFRKAVEQCELMNIRHEMIKIADTVFREDVFYGYEFESKDSYFIQKLNPNYCRIVAVEDGVYTFEFDFSYFNSRQGLLDYYGSEFKKKYELYKTDQSKLRWQELSTKSSVCIKLNETSLAVVPPFAGTFPDIFDITDYKELKKAKTEIDNYKLISLMLPYEHGNFKIPLPVAMDFYSQLSEQIPEGIGLGMTPMDLKEVDFERSGSTQDTDTVVKSVNDFWFSAGTNNAIFGNPDVTASSSLLLAIEADAAIVYNLMDQMARWINKKLKQLPGTYHFKLTFLHQTIFNAKDVQNQLVSAAQYSFPVKYAAAASFGISQSDFEGLLVLENQIVNLQEKMIPVSSTHTQSNDGKAGRPKQDTTDTAGEQSEVNSSNDLR